MKKWLLLGYALITWQQQLQAWGKDFRAVLAALQTVKVAQATLH